jgi:FlaA1/EpsC-like NDP-sugar epimerase
MMENLAEAAFPGHAPHVYTGLRPGGEKRHELLMSGEEAARAVDLTGVSIVLPHLATWREKSMWAHEPKAAPVLRSSQFAEQLSVQELRALLGPARRRRLQPRPCGRLLGKNHCVTQ